MHTKKKNSCFESFEALFKEGKHVHALVIASKCEELQTHPYYKQMQEEFYFRLKRAAAALKKNDFNLAKELIGAYARVEEKKEIVFLLLRYGNKFLEFLHAVKKREYEKVYTACMQYPSFTKTPSFVAMHTQLSSCFYKMQESIEKLDKEEHLLAKRLAPFFKEAADVLKRASLFEQFQKAYEKEDFVFCFSLLDAHPFLKTTQQGSALIRYRNRNYEKAKECAKKGDLETFFFLFEDFLLVSIEEEELWRLFCQTACTKIEYLFSRHEYDAAEKILFIALKYCKKEKRVEELVKKYYEISGIKVVG